jgi:hypothetical protein
MFVKVLSGLAQTPLIPNGKLENHGFREGR